VPVHAPLGDADVVVARISSAGADRVAAVIVAVGAVGVAVVAVVVVAATATVV
jgi:hypothetical protein